MSKRTLRVVTVEMTHAAETCVYGTDDEVQAAIDAYAKHEFGRHSGGVRIVTERPLKSSSDLPEGWSARSLPWEDPDLFAADISIGDLLDGR